jgi:threonine synthase
VAGLLRNHRAGLVDPGQVVVITVTGHGLKDVDTALAGVGEVTKLVVPPDPLAAARALELD